MIWLGFTMPCYEIREWFHTQVEVLYPRISLYSVLGIFGDVHIQACLFWVMPSQTRFLTYLFIPAYRIQERDSKNWSCLNCLHEAEN